jgi:hypothetical protein
MEASSAPTITVVLVLAAMGLKVTDLLKFVTNAFKGGDTAKRAQNDLVTFMAAWVIGIGSGYILRSTAWADEVTIGQETLSTLDVWSMVVFGLVFSTVAGTLYDFKKAIDSSDSAKKPPLLTNTPEEPTAGSSA